MSVSQTVDGNYRHSCLSTVTSQYVIDSGIIDYAVNENRLIFRFSGDGNFKQKTERAFAKFLLDISSKKELCEGSDILS